MTKPKLIIPTVHLNGTSGETLFTEYMLAMHKVSEALDAISAITTHGRDYYNQADVGMVHKALDQRANWYNALADMRNDLTEIALAIQHQNLARKK